jgi:predicted dehydrogenase
MRNRVLLIGLGKIGMDYDFDEADPDVVTTHAKAFGTHPDFELVGGVDLDMTACSRFSSRYGGWVGSDLVEGLKLTKPDVVVIASPTSHHAECVRLILLHTKTKLILCEKPLAYSLEEAEYIVTVCREANCLLYVNYPRRIEPGVLEIKRRIQDGSIALPLKGVLWYSKGLLHSGSHFSNLLELWLGQIESFRIIDSGRSLGNEDFEPDVNVKFAGGDVTFLAMKEEDFSHHEIQLVSSKGCLRYEQGGAKILWQIVERDPIFPEYKVLALPGERIPSGGNKLQWHVSNNISACLRGNSSSLCSGEDALKTLKSLLKMREAL